ncbi:MauE/DoxX family redox-associated membrane protein [Botrimarina hoheduenensis]|uniref:Methylamine utilisation protein MauE domain-containing protein n=1 Tax=Botrimarina hoheduenensis TaxID=2528000 RepID=A0A5C5VV05_9BACT|nr:MauE/DoxX family redox-associated membrane protein [Botrimarina hoheduenensis]TWT41352.1 hypothetical protein Pla111_30660 [Botrimarina hoheduenensis]
MTSDNLQAPRRVVAGSIVRIFLGVLLVVAAFAKGLSPAGSAEAMFDGWPFAARLLAVQAEMAFGVVLLLGLWRSHVHNAAIVIFTGFALIALRSVLVGEQSCGCFGAIAVDPRLTLLIDFAAVVALLWTRATGCKEPFFVAGRRVVVGAVALVAIGVPLGVAMAFSSPVRDVAIASTVKFVLLEPETWVGRRLPLLGVLEGASGLASGEWTVLMHHHGCPDCERVRPDYENRIVQGEQVLLVETPPYSEPDAELDSGHARLPSDREWFVHTPVEIVVADGVVVSVNRELLSGEEARL